MQIVLENQRIRSISKLPGFDYADAPKVTHLILNENPIKDFAQLVAFKKLQYLEIDNTNIEKLPEEIARLTALRHLSCRYNALIEIPDWIGKLIELRVLNFRGNEINYLPLVFEKLSKLEELHVDYNNIDDISAELIHQLSGLNLKVFETNGNPLSSIKAGLLEASSASKNDTDDTGLTLTQDAGQTLSLLSDQLKGELGYLNQVKVVILGGGGIGKSSLIQSVINDEPTLSEHSTEGIDIYSEKHWEPGIYVHGGKVKIAIWDFGGQHIMHDIHKLFLSEETIYVILDNVVEADRSPIYGVKYWLRHIEHINKGERKSSILVAFHRADRPEQDSYVEDLTEQLLHNYGVKECLCTSVKRPETIGAFKDCLKETIRQVAERQEHVPLYFIKARDLLLEHKRPYITREELREILREVRFGNGENRSNIEINDAEVNFCIDFFNRIGVIVKFSSNSRGRTFVLKPNWISTAIYQIMISPKIKNKRGKFTVQFLIDHIEVLKKGYGDMEVDFIIDLMVDYKLAFPVEEKHALRTFLIPTLLGSRNSSDYILSNSSLRMRMNYYIGNEKGNDYSEHTRSVLARFICQQYLLIDSGTVRRDYCFLQDADHKIEIFIVPDSGDKEIELRVQGDQAVLFLNKYLHLIEVSNNFFEAKAKKMIPVQEELGIYHWQDYAELQAAQKEGETMFFIGFIRRKIDIREMLAPYIITGMQDPITILLEKIRNHPAPVAQIKILIHTKNFKCAHSAEALYNGLINDRQEHISELQKLIIADYKQQEDMAPQREWMHVIGQELQITETQINEFKGAVTTNKEWEALIKKLYVPRLACYGAYKAYFDFGDSIDLDYYFNFLTGKLKEMFELDEKQFSCQINLKSLPASTPLLMIRLGDVIAQLLAHEILLNQSSEDKFGKISFLAEIIAGNRCKVEVSRNNNDQGLEERVKQIIEMVLQQRDGVFSPENNVWRLTFTWS